MIFSLAQPVVGVTKILDNPSDFSCDFIDFSLVLSFLSIIISLSKKFFLQCFLELVESELLLNAITELLGRISVFFSVNDINISLSLFISDSLIIVQSVLLFESSSSFFICFPFLFFSCLLFLDFNLSGFNFR